DKEISGEVLEFVKAQLRELLAGTGGGITYAPAGPTVVMVAGVNGSGKTTSIAKLAKRFQGEGKKVAVAACDTFRAAAVEQLTVWAGRIGCDIIKQGQGVQPAAVAHDACEAAKARGYDVLIVDTAGRLHTQTPRRRGWGRTAPGAGGGEALPGGGRGDGGRHHQPGPGGAARGGGPGRLRGGQGRWLGLADRGPRGPAAPPDALVKELEKIRTVVSRQIPGAPHEVL